ncbi:hypothetical protein Q0M94_28630 (plasmid) [Deinococcus radiomollis]|uniref:hypothetical protein n=1 Tax=Deinococcus radiomollis TaxID=468916 RepID=UPI0038920A2E
MPAPIPTLPVKVQGFELYQAGVLLASLPVSLKPPDIGRPPDITLERPPLSPVYFQVGDGIERPVPLVITGPMYDWPDYLSAITGQYELQKAAAIADTLTFGGLPFCPLLPGGYLVAQALTTAALYTLTLTLYPAGPFNAISIQEAIL